MNFKTFAFFGIPKNHPLSPALLERVNLERARVYFGNTMGNIASLIAGTVLASGVLYTLDVSILVISCWALVLFFLGGLAWKYEKNVLAKGLHVNYLHPSTASYWYWIFDWCCVGVVCFYCTCGFILGVFSLFYRYFHVGDYWDAEL